MPIRRFALPLFTAVLTSAGYGHSHAEYLFQGLGTLGGEFSVAYGLAANAPVVVGWSRNAAEDGRAFRWQEGAMIALGDERHWAATAVSADGAVVMIQAYGGGVFRWKAGVLIGLPLGGSWEARAWDVSADGSVIVGDTSGIFFNPPGPAQSYTDPVVWGPPDAQGNFGLRALYDLTLFDTEDGQDSAYAVSPDGSVIVGVSQERSGDVKAVRWHNYPFSGSPLTLGTLGGRNSAAYDISADGSVVVGWAERADGLREAFRWENDTMVGLGTLSGDWLESFAHAVSADGSVVVGHSENAQSQSEPFIWDQAHGMRSLTELLTQNGVDLSDWDLDTAVDISADGRVIVGNGYHISLGRQEAWIATIPEPSTLTALATLAAALLLANPWRKRNR